MTQPTQSHQADWRAGWWAAVSTFSHHGPATDLIDYLNRIEHLIQHHTAPRRNAELQGARAALKACLALRALLK